MTKTELRELIDLWPTLDDAIQAKCSCCADMSERLVWIDGAPVVQACPVCAAGDEGEGE